jgi:hypothetical protein
MCCEFVILKAVRSLGCLNDEHAVLPAGRELPPDGLSTFCKR